MHKGKIFFSITITIIFFSSSLLIETSACFCECDPRQQIFSLGLMSIFEKNDVNNEISILIQEKLPSIGIGVGIHEVTHWGNILQRIHINQFLDWNNIPTYAEGGFDLFAFEHPHELDYFPPGLSWDFPSAWKYDSILFSFYGSIPYWQNIQEYFSTLNQSEKVSYSHNLQEILYEDLPSVPIYYPRELVLLSNDIGGYDENLFYSCEIRTDKWYDLGDEIINYSLPVFFDDYNYFTKGTKKDLLWLNSVYGSLFRRAQKTKYWEEFLASNYSFSEVLEGRFNVTVELDPNARFSDGSLVLAEDVKYSYELLLSPEVGSNDYDRLNEVFISNDSIIVENSTTIMFCFEQILDTPLSYLSYGIIDKSYLEPFITSYGYNIFNEEPLTGNVQDALVTSCGPYMLESFNNYDKETILTPNPYWKDGELSNNLTFTDIEDPKDAFVDLLAGEIDIMDNSYTEYLLEKMNYNNSMYQVKYIEVPATYEVVFNMKHPIFGTGELTPVGTSEAAKNMRKGISHIIPREYIVNTVLKGLGVPAGSYIPKACVGYNSNLEPFVYDFDKAVEYTEYGGYVCMCTPTQTTPSGDRTIFLITLFSLISVSILCQTKLKNKK